MEGQQFGMRPEDADTGAFFARLHARMIQRDPPRRADVMRFLMRCETKEDVQNAVTLLKAFRPWMPKLEVTAGSLLLRACLRAGDLDLAVEVMGAHRQLRAQLSKSVCNDLLAALSKEGRSDEMLTAFSYMRTAQPKVASAKALGIIAAGLGHAGEVSKAVEILLQTRAAGVKPSKFCYLVLLKGCNKAMDDPESRPAAEQARTKIGKLMVEDKIKDAECDTLLAYSPAAAAVPAGEEPEEKKE